LRPAKRWTAQRQQGAGDAAGGVADDALFAGEVAGDARTPSASMRSMSGTMGEAPSAA
jgi:hypothetical protein